VVNFSSWVSRFRKLPSPNTWSGIGSHRRRPGGHSSCAISSNNLPDQQINHRAYSHIEQKSGIKLKNVVSERFRRKRRNEEVKKISQQNRQQHLHPVTNHSFQPISVTIST